MNKVTFTDDGSQRFSVGDTIAVKTEFQWYPSIIAQVDTGIVAVIDLATGNRWKEGIQVFDVKDIEEKTVSKLITGYEFKRINNVVINLKED